MFKLKTDWQLIILGYDLTKVGFVEFLDDDIDGLSAAILKSSKSSIVVSSMMHSIFEIFYKYKF